MSLLDQALRFAEMGYFCYPVNLTINEEGKKVVDFPGNWRDSSRDSEILSELFVDGVTGIAIDTGKSGIVVVDIDINGEKAGLSNLRDAGIDLPNSPSRVRTWSGGFHGFFKQPATPVGSGSNRPVKDVDFRGVGGIVFAPGTLVLDAMGHEAGRYRELSPILPVDELPVLPEGYASRLRPTSSKTRPAVSTALRAPTVREDQARVLQKFVDDDLEIIRMAGNGERNEILGQTSILLADRCLKLGYGWDDYLDMVLEAYKDSGGTDPKQPEDWAKSAWKKAVETPLAMPTTYVDKMAQEEYDRQVARRLANSRMVGSTSRMISTASFVDWTQPPPPAQFWIHGVIPKGEQVVLYGKPEAGKTFMALDWSMSVACGRTTWGRRVSPGRVWFMAGEGNARITARMHAWQQYTGIEVDPRQMKLLNHVPDLLNDQVIEQLAQRIAEDRVDLIVIDTLSRAMAIGGGDVSEVKDAGVALHNLQALSKYRPDTTPLAIHHPIKEGSMAGAYKILAGLDVVLHAEVFNDGVGVLKFAKNKDGEKTKICEYEWQPVGPSAVLVPAHGRT